MELNQDGSEVHETTEEVAEETTETLSPEQIAELKKNAAASSKNFERAKKAEAELKEARSRLDSSTVKQDDLSNQDVLALAKSGVDEDDLEEVMEFAKFKKIPVKDALKHPMLKGILETKTEERRSAAATHTKGSARGASKVTGEDLLTKAQQTGEVPTTTEGLQALFKARRGLK